jgi:hypothetical protein
VAVTEREGTLDFGARSNESVYGAFDERESSSKDSPFPRKARRAVETELLPFIVGIVDDEAMLVKVQALRESAYGHHLPAIAAAFGMADPVDRLADVTLFYAQDKSTGRMVGSARVQSNLSGPLHIEKSIVLPEERQGQLLCEVSRLTVLPGYIPPVRLALVKALHLFCIANQIGGVVAGSRRSLLRQYLNLGFSDLYGDERLVPLAYVGGLEHRILFRDTVTSEAESRARSHPDHGFVFRTFHPDILVFRKVLEQTSAGLGSSRYDQIYSSKAA